MNGRIRKLTVIWVIALAVTIAGAACAQLTGAVWTTAADGAKVDANIYDQKCPPEPPADPCVTPPLVPFLSGGPSFASPTRWVPDGDYFFQVTDPSGKVLLSTDSVWDRQFTVATDGNGKKYVIYSGPHVTCNDWLSGVVTIALCPFEDTPNNGNEYKLWITRVEDYDESMADSWSGGCSYGFIPRNSKTDNFKVRGLASVWGEKFDDEGNPLEGVHIILYEVRKVRGQETLVRIADTCTDGNGEFSFTNLPVGKYAVDEDLDLSQPPIPGCAIDYSGYERVSPAGPIYFNITKADTGGRGRNAGPGELIYIGAFVNKIIIPPKAALYGIKFLDVNGNGEWDPATEMPLGDWQICLEMKAGNGTWVPAVDINGVLVPCQMTGPAGEFLFPNLPVPMTYRICEIPKAGWLQTGPNPGPVEELLWPALDTYIVVTPPDADVTVTAANGCYVVNFGATALELTEVAALTFGNKLAELCVRKVEEGTGAPLAGWEFTLFEADGVTPAKDGFGNPVMPITTDGTGTACWDNLLGGDYVVKETPKPGWRPVPPGSDAKPVTLPAGGAVTVTFTNRSICMGLTPGYWKNWRNHYTAGQFCDLLQGTIADVDGCDADIAAADTIFEHWDASPGDELTIMAAFLLANQLTLNLTQQPGLPNPSGGSLVPECVCGTRECVCGTVSLGDAIASALAILANPGDYSRDDILNVKNQLAAFAEARCP